MKRAIILLVTLIGSLSMATDCNTNCEKACTVDDYGVKYLDYACKWRCEGERTLSCETGLNGCATWVANPNFYNAVAAISVGSVAGLVRDVHQCHKIVDGGATVWTGVSAMATAADVALTIANSTPLTILVEKAAKHILHCACNYARYAELETDAQGNPIPGNDQFYYSAHSAKGLFGVGTGGMAIGPLLGAKKAAKRAEVLTQIGGSAARSDSGFFNSLATTTTHALCKQKAFSERANGGASLKSAVQKAKSNGYTHCLFRVVNGDELGKVFDSYYVSLVKGNAWVELRGKRNQRNALFQQAKNKLGGSYDKMQEGYFSEARIVSTEVGCQDTDGPVRFATTGKGGQSIKKAFDKAKSAGYKRCLFEVHDRSF